MFIRLSPLASKKFSNTGEKETNTHGTCQLGKRQIHMAPAKLYKSQNFKTSSHVSTKFAHSSTGALEEITAILGPYEVTFHSIDGKAKRPVGITGAKKQTPLLMDMKNQVTFPDHDFVVSSKHDLIPSVKGDQNFIESKDLTTDAVSYSSPTQIAIRSAKNFGSL